MASAGPMALVRRQACICA